MKAKKFPTLLEGETLAIWIELTTEEKDSYTTSKAKIIARMVPVQFVSLDDFRARKLNHGESLPVFLHELKNAVQEGYARCRGGYTKSTSYSSICW